MLHTFETSSTYAARRERDDLVEEWERTSKVNIYDDAAMEGVEAPLEEGNKSSSLDYARRLVTEDDLSLSQTNSNGSSGNSNNGNDRFDDEDDHSLHTTGTHSNGSQPNLYDFANVEPSTYNPRHGAGFLRCFACWMNNVKLSRRGTCLLVTSLLIVLSVIIGVSVGVTNKNRHKSGVVIDDGPSTPTTTYGFPSGTSNDGNPSFAHSIVSDLLTFHDILDITTFENLESPQRLAVDYLLDSSLSKTKIHKGHMHLQDWKTNQVLRNLVELYSLAVFYYSTQQPQGSGALTGSWILEDNWLDPQLEDPCTWHGITCGKVVVVAESNSIASSTNDVRIRGVTHIALPDNGLTGSLVMEIQFLHGLLELDLSYNNFGGDLPQVLPSALHILDLSGNRFQNAIPVFWELPQLEVLDLHENELRGAVPWGGISGTELNFWQSLRDVNLEHNFLTGELPSSEQLPGVEKLILNTNRFSGYLEADLGNMRHLRELSLRENRLRGALPSTLDQLTGLRSLNVGENILVGSLDVCSRLSSLKELYVNQNRFNGPLPSSWSSISSLTSLVASRNELTGTLPSTIGELTALVTLILDFNKFTGTIPPALGNMGALQVLKLSDNNLEGEIPAALASQLQELDVDSNISK
jgi:Leucine-rich repeat (LRR) protein